MRNRLQGNDRCENCFPSDLVRQLVLVVAGILALAFTVRAGAESITLQWDTPNTTSEISGYEVHHGLESGQYYEVLPVNGAATDTRLVEGLGAGTHYFSVRSVNDDGSQVSAFSNEIIATISSSPVDDDDGDGVSDAADQCPNTPAGEPVDSSGCPFAATELKVMINGQSETHPVLTYGGNQDNGASTLEVLDDGATLRIVGNGWKQVRLNAPYTVTADTMLEVTFSGRVQGEFHGIGLDDDDAVSDDRNFQFYGTQSWGLQDFNDYAGGTVTYRIPVGSYYSGSFDRLFFVMDQDTSSADGESVFSNIALYEAGTPVSDSDGDGVSDAADQCPGTPAGASVDTSGCSVSQVYSVGEGLTAAYGFEEDQGTAVVDASGNGNDGSLFGPTRTAAGHSGSALAFDGTNDRVDLNTLDISGGDVLTISAWMKADDFGTYDARLVSKATGVQENDHYWMVSTFSNNSLRFRLKAGGSTATLISNSNVIAAGKWHHVAATYDGARMAIYVDGAQVASTAKSGSIATNSSVPAAIGNQPQGGNPFDGTIDEVRIYNRALSGADIQKDMTTTVAVDADADGVSDAVDQCPNTPAGESVDSAGCSTSQVDSDGDGVSDSLDQCPGTPAGMPTDASGCPLAAVGLEVVINGQSETHPVLTYGGFQDNGDSTVEVLDDGATLRIVGNGWKQVQLNAPYTVTADTMLEVTFSGRVQGEFHGIGLDDDDAVSDDRNFQFYGTQSWGLQDFNDYAGGTVTYRIPVGSYYSGSFDRLFFVMDQDTSNAGGESVFSNIALYEAGTPVGDGVSDAADQCSGTPAGASVDTSGCSASQIDRNSGVEGLTAAYGFEGDQGMVVVDASGNGNDGSLFGPTRTAAGHSGSALSFDGTNDRVDLNALDIGGGDGMAVSLWMKADDFGTYDARLVSKATGVQENDHYWMVSTFSNNSVRFRLKAGGSTATLISNSNVIAAGKWHHVAATYDGTRMAIYVDGAQVASTAKSGSIATNSSVPAAIGNQPQGGNPFDGTIDEVRIYDRALSGADIRTDMTNTDITAPSAAIAGSATGPAYNSTQSEAITATPGNDATDTTGALSDLLERGEIEVGDEWQWVDFAVPFADAVVVAKPLGYNDADPAVVRIDGIDANGFWIRVQEWDYLDGTHAPEVVSYLAMERGLHQLTDNTWIEAGRIESDAGIETAFVRHNFQAPFTQAPVVLAAVTSDTEGDPLITRVRNIDDAGFEVRLQEEEAADQIPMPAAIDYIAWEPSSGVIDGVEFEVGRTTNEVTHAGHILAYQEAFAVSPVFLADTQTQNGADAANLRWQNKSASAVDVSVAEEQSSDDETNHVAETVGYIAMDPPPLAQDGLPGVIAAYSFDEGAGDAVIDASGNGKDGIVSGATRTAGGWSGNALNFDGIDDWVDLEELDIDGDDGLTITLWMKADDFGTYDARLVSKATGNSERDHYWMISTFSNNSVRFRLKAGGSTTTLLSGNDVIAAGQWHRVAATFDGARMVLYVDGVEVASTPKSGTIDTNNSVPAGLGDQPHGGKAFDGLIDEVRIYNRALTSGEIQK